MKLLIGGVFLILILARILVIVADEYKKHQPMTEEEFDYEAW